jgi:hypothetical protein
MKLSKYDLFGDVSLEITVEYDAEENSIDVLSIIVREYDIEVDITNILEQKYTSISEYITTSIDWFEIYRDKLYEIENPNYSDL